MEGLRDTGEQREAFVMKLNEDVPHNSTNIIYIITCGPYICDEAALTR